MLKRLSLKIVIEKEMGLHAPVQLSNRSLTIMSEVKYFQKREVQHVLFSAF